MNGRLNAIAGVAVRPEAASGATWPQIAPGVLGSDAARQPLLAVLDWAALRLKE